MAACNRRSGRECSPGSDPGTYDAIDARWERAGTIMITIVASGRPFASIDRSSSSPHSLTSSPSSFRAMSSASVIDRPPSAMGDDAAAAAPPETTPPSLSQLVVQLGDLARSAKSMQPHALAQNLERLAVDLRRASTAGEERAAPRTSLGQPPCDSMQTACRPFPCLPPSLPHPLHLQQQRIRDQRQLEAQQKKQQKPGLPHATHQHPLPRRSSGKVGAASAGAGLLPCFPRLGLRPSPGELHALAQPADKPKKDIDFSRFRQRYVALEVMYLGAGLHGFARQVGVTPGRGWSGKRSGE